MLRRFLALFADVRKGETAGALLLALNIFLLMTAYYVLKTVREPLILAGETAALLDGGGSEVKSYLAAAQALTLVVAVPAYSALANRLKPMQLLSAVTIFFIVCIQGFYAAAKFDVPYLGIPFYIWVGIFSLSVIAQFWSYANDVYTKDQGERLFPMLALGMTAGAAMGSKVADLLFSAGVGTFEMMQVSALILAATLGLYVVASRAMSSVEEEEAKEEPGEEDTRGGFALVLANPYIRWIAALFLLLNLVNTTGEFILASLVEERANEVAGGDPGAWIGSFYGDFYFWVNLGAIAVQALLVSRLVKWTGLAGVLFLLPAISLGTYGLVAFGVGLGVFRWAKTAENLTDYSVMNTAKAMIWLPTTQAEKYKAKAAIDTFVVRIGDVASAALVYVGLNTLGFGPQQFGMVNLGAIALWAFVAFQVWRHYQGIEPQEAEAGEPAGAAA